MIESEERMTFSEFKVLVAGFAQRDPSSFVIGSTDVLTSAINLAKRWAERNHNFFYSKVSALLADVDVQTGADLADAVLLSDPEVAVSIKYIHKAYFPFEATTPTMYCPIEVVSREQTIERTQRYYQGEVTKWKPRQQVPPLGGYTNAAMSYWCVYQWEGKLWISPQSVDALGAQTIDVVLDVTKWLPPYVADDDEDFFLTDCQDFLLMRSIYQLNLFVKEDVRVPISVKAMQEMWESVVMWDSNIVSSTTHENNLD
jgi:hypothetical protein